MKKLVLISLIIAIQLFNVLNAQNLDSKEIVGVWQENDSLLASGLDNVYRFYSDGTFHFDVGYGYLTRLLSLRGRYCVNKNLISFTVTETIESEGGEISFGDDSDELRWTYIKDHGKRHVLSKPKTFSSQLSIVFGEQKEISMIKIAYFHYFKISKDPNAYDDCCGPLKFLQIK